MRRADADAFGRQLAPGALRIDLGCGAGRYTADLGTPVIGLDAVADHARPVPAPRSPPPFSSRAISRPFPSAASCLGGGWANMSYLHVPEVRLPLALADLHRVLVVGAPVDIQVLVGLTTRDGPCPTTTSAAASSPSWTADALRDVLVGAGFDVTGLEVDDDVVRARAVRARTLADIVGPGMRLLIVGLNPSLYSADRGVGYARPGNRFWPALLAAGLVTRDRDPSMPSAPTAWA